MLYADFIPGLRAQIARVSASGRGVAFPDLLAALKGQSTPSADEACRLIALGQDPPTLRRRPRAEVLCRLACAEWYCLESFYQDIEDATPREFLESLLIEFWHSSGRVEWLAQVLGLTGDYDPPVLLDGPN